MNCLVFTKVRNKQGIMFRAGLYGNYAALSESILCVKWSSSTLNFNWYVFCKCNGLFFPLSFPLCLSSSPTPLLSLLSVKCLGLEPENPETGTNVGCLCCCFCCFLGRICCCLEEKKKREKGVSFFCLSCSWEGILCDLCFLPLVDDWRSSSNTDANGDAQPSSLAAKGYRSVRPNLSSDSKPQVSLSSVTLRVIFWVQALDSQSGVLGWTPNFAADLGKLLCLSFSYH